MSLGFNLKSTILGFTFQNQQGRNETKERVKIETKRVEKLESMLFQADDTKSTKVWYA